MPCWTRLICGDVKGWGLSDWLVWMVGLKICTPFRIRRNAIPCISSRMVGLKIAGRANHRPDLTSIDHLRWSWSWGCCDGHEKHKTSEGASSKSPFLRSPSGFHLITMSPLFCCASIKPYRPSTSNIKPSSPLSWPGPISPWTLRRTPATRPISPI